MTSGSFKDENIDIITSGNLGEGAVSLTSQQHFETGEEDLEMDVTKFVSASVKNIIPNYGFLIAFSGSHEKDTRSYFVKRFASRNSANTSIRPKLIYKYDDSLQDNHRDFIFDH